jgi:hypothetical protein
MTGPVDGLGPLDATDLALLAEIRAAYELLDPVPADLVQRAQFALELQALDIEVGRLVEAARDDALVGARGDEVSRTITFDSDSLTIMIRISLAPGGTVRIDGWLAPPAPHEVEVRTLGGAVLARADDDGRFVVEPIPRGMAQLVVRTRAASPQDDGRTVVTPSIVV